MKGWFWVVVSKEFKLVVFFFSEKKKYKSFFFVFFKVFLGLEFIKDNVGDRSFEYFVFVFLI